MQAEDREPDSGETTAPMSIYTLETPKVVFISATAYRQTREFRNAVLSDLQFASLFGTPDEAIIQARLLWKDAHVWNYPDMAKADATTFMRGVDIIHIRIDREF